MIRFETTHRVVGPEKDLEDEQLYLLLDWVIGEMTGYNLEEYAKVAEYPDCILELASAIKKE